MISLTDAEREALAPFTGSEYSLYGAVEKIIEQRLAEAHSCPVGEVEVKYDGGRWALLCSRCRVIVGYMGLAPDVTQVLAEQAEAIAVAIEGWSEVWRGELTRVVEARSHAARIARSFGGAK